MHYLDIFLKISQWLFLLYMGVAILFYTAIFLISAFTLRKKRERDENRELLHYLQSGITRPVSIIVPAYNEGVTIVSSVQSLLTLEYPEFEVIVVNDGSSDDTLEQLKDHFQLYEIQNVVRLQLETEPIRKIYRSSVNKQIIVVDKENGGKADALNAGINISNYPYVCSLDADSLLERDALMKAMKPIYESPEKVMVTGGSVRIVNGSYIQNGQMIENRLPKQPLALMQIIEYLRGFLFGRLAWSKYNILPIISGAFGIFDKGEVIRVGGYQRKTVGEDMELVVHLHKKALQDGEEKKIIYNPNAICWTQAPDDLTTFRKQRSRWHRGLGETLWRHKDILFRPKYKAFGMIAMPFYLLLEWLGPIIEILGYLLLLYHLLFDEIFTEYVFLLLAATVLYGSFLSVGVVLLEEWSMKKQNSIKDFTLLLLWSLTESFWYRPLTVWYRFLGLFQSLFRIKGWGKMKRKSLENQSSERFWWLRRIAFILIILAVIFGIDATKHRLQPTFLKSTADNISYGFKAERSKQTLQHYTGGKWEDWTIKGVNLGMAKPGAFPGDAAITKAEYKKWLKQISEMGANTIRIYTIHPPAFYEALFEFNQQAKQPLYFFHGVWVEEEQLLETKDAYQSKNELFKNIERTADVIHGNTTIAAEKGHAYGEYNYDVSQYLAGWILGIEWDPDMVIETNKKHADKTSFKGKYFEAKNASPFEIWLAEGMNHIAQYSISKYETAQPIAFSNWVTTDLLDHPAEPFVGEDAVSINPNHIFANKNYPSGAFASYHVYPYYPDFLNFDPDKANFKDHRGQSNSYAAYLKDLHDSHEMPVVISEFGIPGSRGISHKNIHGKDQGHMNEDEQGKRNAELFEDIIEAKLAGGIVFIWQDEWFKFSWNTTKYDNTEERPHWNNVQVPEQHFGLLSFESHTINVDGDTNDWKTKTKIGDKNGYTTFVTHDESYLYLSIDRPKARPFEEEPITIGINILPEQGNKEFNGLSMKKGADFKVDLHGGQSNQVLVDSYYDVFSYEFGFQRNLIPYTKPEKNSGQFSPIYTALSLPITLPLTQEQLPFEKFNVGALTMGNSNPTSADYNSLADFSTPEKETIEIRIPWMVLNAKAPNIKEFIGDIYANEEIDGLTTKQIINAIGFTVQIGAENITTAQDGEYAMYNYSKWGDVVEYTSRLKKSYYYMQKVYQATK
ncbi:glycosyltransferase [Bacillus cereus]|nr:glycosyltransferase [Bacillus cereus]